METTKLSSNKFLTGFFKNDTTFTITLVLTFFLLSMIGILNHEMWRDELQAWLIARDSSSLPDLFKNLKYEGHPGLWHIFLYVISRFTSNPIAMQFFHLIIATATIYVFTNFSPFTRLQKILFAFSYFSFYEYSIISRNYGLGVLLIFLFCKFFGERQQNYLLLSCILALLANTNAYSFLLSICLAITLVIELLISKIQNKSISINKGILTISFIVFALGISLALVQLIPPANSNFQGDVIQRGSSRHIGHLASVLVTIWRSYIPIPNVFNYNFWDTNILLDSEGSVSKLLKLCVAIFSVGLLVISIKLFIQKPVALFLYLLGNFSLLSFMYLKHLGSIRHHGHLFILFLACLWIASFYEKSDFFSKRLKYLNPLSNNHKYQYLNILLSLQVLAGVFAFTMDLHYPFSSSKEAASFIESQKFNKTLIVGIRDFSVAPITAFLKQKIYYPESDTFGGFVHWNKRQMLSSQQVVDEINNFVEQQNQQTLLILSSEINTKKKNFNYFEFWKSSKSITKEDYRLYLIKK